jgi:hypothetical protein
LHKHSSDIGAAWTGIPRLILFGNFTAALHPPLLPLL